MRESQIVESAAALVGGTPLLRASRFAAASGLMNAPLLKLEYLNPTGSAKDRAALSMLEAAERDGRLVPGATIIEPTSGNTGIALAALAAARGYRVILTMPETMTAERRKLLAVYGAEIVLTPGAQGMRGAIEKAEELAAETENSFIPSQFENPANPQAHYETTGPEIYAQTNGAVDIFVAGIGTGGTISGTGRYLKRMNPNVKIVAFEPSGSPYLTEGRAGTHGLQGIGAGFKPDNLDLSVIDEVLTIDDDDAYQTGAALARSEGILVGITSGAAVFAAKLLAERDENKGKMIVALLPDTGDRYLSTPMFAE